MSIAHKLDWQESMNGVTIDCSLDMAIHPADSDTVLLTIPGVDGSVDGYEKKYVRMVERYQDAYGVAAVRIENPFITSFHWESNPRHALEYILDNAKEVTGRDTPPKIVVVAHSAGASIIAKIAGDYPAIKRLLLINPAKKLLSPEEIEKGMGAIVDHSTVVFGGSDPSVDMAHDLRNEWLKVHIVDGADHNFSGEFLNTFINLPTRYLKP